MTESFEDAIKALRHIARGNGSVMRIADRIVAAHERETKVEGVYGPITGELRGAMRQWGWVESDGSITFATSPTPPSIDAEQSLAISGSDFDRYCDAIDSIHAQLEREYEDLRMKFVNANRHAHHVERENESLKAELDRVLGEQEEHAHTRGESITDELRKWGYGFCGDTHDVVTAIADRIDAEYERVRAESIIDMTDESMAEHGWVRLPVDADGVPIRVGDTVEYVDDTLAPRNVTSINLAGDGWWVYINGVGRQPDMYRHVTPDTWERIIEDALDGYHDTDFENLVARCKALAGDAE